MQNNKGCTLRNDGRRHDELRRARITMNYLKFAEGSVMIDMGDTKVICTATVEAGWITAEYSMLPRSSKTRIRRESTAGKVGGRTHEIQRLIGRSLRAVVDLNLLGERTVWIDCDVIQADGGTRTASITGAFVALTGTLMSIHNKGMIEKMPVLDSIAAVSVGIVDGAGLLDLTYEEDSRADVDMNIVMTGTGRFVEVQGTAESNPFSGKDMEKMLALAVAGIKELTQKQIDVLGSFK